MKRGYKYRVYPTKEQEQLFSQYFGVCRFVYNTALDLKKYVYSAYGITLSGFDLSKQVTQAKKEGGFEWLSDVPADTLIQETQYLDVAYKNFFRRIKQGKEGKEAGFPKFKSRYDKQSFYLRVARQGNPTIKFDRNPGQRSSRIWINKKIGWVKYIDDRVGKAGKQPKGKLCANATLSKTKSGKYYISLIYDDLLPDPSKTDKVFSKDGFYLGVDMGVNSMLITSEGEKIDGFDGYRKAQKNLKAKQVKLNGMEGSKKGEKKSNNYLKQKKKIAKIHERVASTRKHYIEEAVTRLISQNPDAIFVESLSVKNMSKSANEENPGKMVKQKSGLNKAILDQGWGYLLEFLGRKCSEKGISLHKIDRWFASSQICSCCGFQNKKVKEKNLRFWVCPECGSDHDRDVNAAINIRNQGIKELFENSHSEGGSSLLSINKKPVDE